MIQTILDGSIYDAKNRKAGTLLIDDKISCKRLESSDPKSIGKIFEIEKIHHKNVILDYLDGFYLIMTKAFESDDTITLTHVAGAAPNSLEGGGTGATHTLVINKKDGQFAESESSVLFRANVVAHVGTCVSKGVKSVVE